MKAVLTLTAALAVAAVSAPLEAKTSSEAEYRGYQTCVSAAQDETRGLVTERQYLIEKEMGSTQYYVNGTHWVEGDREQVRIACETAARGSRLVSAETAPGRYIRQAGQVRVEVAQK